MKSLGVVAMCVALAGCASTIDSVTAAHPAAVFRSTRPVQVVADCAYVGMSNAATMQKLPLISGVRLVERMPSTAGLVVTRVIDVTPDGQGSLVSYYEYALTLGLGPDRQIVRDCAEKKA